MTPPPFAGGSGSETFYHQAQGTEHLWLSVLRSIPSLASLRGQVTGFQAFIDNPERFGLLPDPNGPEGLPVGLAITPVTERQPNARVGFNCAACHVGEFHYQGRKVRVDGAPSLINLEVFNLEAIAVMGALLKDKTQLAAFLERLSERLPGVSGGSLAERLQAAYPDSDLTPDGNRDAREKLADEVEWFLSTQPQKKEECPPHMDMLVDQYVHDVSRKQIRTVSDALRLLQGHMVYLGRHCAVTEKMTAAGPGRVDAFGVARSMLFGPQNAKAVPLNAPVSFMCLWEFQNQTWLHWDGNTNSIMQRNIGQSLGMGATVNRKTHDSSIRPRDLDHLERLSHEMKAPAWPRELFGAPDATRLGRGRVLFERECGSCHGPDIEPVPWQQVRTDPNRALNFAAEVQSQEGRFPFYAALWELLTHVESQANERDVISEEERRRFERESVQWRASLGYVSRPLYGVWATSPYLHNGSVPTLWDLLQPPAKRPAQFILQGWEYDPVKVGYATVTPQDPNAAGYVPLPSGQLAFVFNVKESGNSNEGHPYGTQLSDEEKRDLLEYLKSL
ncbi:di-heme-cytochrome C peroxidase [Archangium sp.]|jgi:hypothetical protein|uniref:di-heme-cytochrome C peroxidase n=1 Tax=Archangium sp. TaxID=1872627 RepID=UPI002EDA5CBC